MQRILEAPGVLKDVIFVFRISPGASRLCRICHSSIQDRTYIVASSAVTEAPETQRAPGRDPSSRVPSPGDGSYSFEVVIFDHPRLRLTSINLSLEHHWGNRVLRIEVHGNGKSCFCSSLSSHSGIEMNVLHLNPAALPAHPYFNI